MLKAAPLYEKLIGWRGGVGTRVSLWLGPDHVLLAESNMMTERYQRVWLRDIQAFLTRPSRESRWAVGIGAGLVVLFVALALGFSDDVAVIWWVFAVLSAPVLVYGLFFARTVRFYAVTAVQRAEWSNVVRRRHVRKVLARLEPLIREAQAADVVPQPPPQAPAGQFPAATGPGPEASTVA